MSEQKVERWQLLQSMEEADGLEAKQSPEEPPTEGTFGVKFTAVTLVAVSAIAFSVATLQVNEVSYLEQRDSVYASFVLFRFALPWLAITLLLLFQGQNPWKEFFDRDVLIRSSTNVLAAVLEVEAMTQLTLIDATVIMFVHPFWAAMLSAGVLGEQWTYGKTALLTLAFGGVVLICHPWASNAHEDLRDPLRSLTGVAAAVGYSFVVAGMNVWTRMRNAKNNVFLLNHHYLALGTMVFLCQHLLSYGTDSWSVMCVSFTRGWREVIVMTFAVAVGEVTCTRGFQMSDVGILSAVRNLDIVMVFIFQTLILHQPPNLMTSLGACLVGTATVLLVGPWLLSNS